jgi:predicted GIY-YIG superfamily endonuclease
MQTNIPPGYRTIQVLDPGIGIKNTLVGPSYREWQTGRWITFEFEDPAHLPHVTCCYVVISPERGPVYVGQTVNLRTRFKQHGFRWENNAWESHKRGTWTGLVFKRRVVQRFGDWAMHERRLIRRLRPIFNPQCT